jgi:DNA-binding transcriptional regulator YiaG
MKIYCPPSLTIIIHSGTKVPDFWAFSCKHLRDDSGRGSLALTINEGEQVLGPDQARALTRAIGRTQAPPLAIRRSTERLERPSSSAASDGRTVSRFLKSSRVIGKLRSEVDHCNQHWTKLIRLDGLSRPPRKERHVVPAQIRAARALLGWSQMELADRAHVSRATLADFEQEKRLPYGRTLDAIIQVIEEEGVVLVDPDYTNPNSQGEGVRFAKPLNTVWKPRDDNCGSQGGLPEDVDPV